MLSITGFSLQIIKKILVRIKNFYILAFYPSELLLKRHILCFSLVRVLKNFHLKISAEEDHPELSC